VAPAAEADVKTPRPQLGRVAVVGAYRPVDARRGAVHDPNAPKARTKPTKKTGAAAETITRPTTQAGLDLYLAVRGDARVRVGQHFAVYRRIRSPIRYASRIQINVGEVEIVRLDNDIAVARVISGPNERAEPYLVTPGVLIGDFILAGAPLASSPQPEVEDAEVAAKSKASAPKGCGPDCVARRKAEKLQDEPEPIVPGSPDGDTFVHWDERPIDF
jgi:hypothetical protein